RLGAASHAASAREMTAWLRRKAGTSSARLADHSGLGGGSRISPADMVSTLVRLGRRAGLRGLLKGVPLTDESGKTALPVDVVAKTGTLNFISTLAGYASVAPGRELAFAIFTGDVARRDALSPAQM